MSRARIAVVAAHGLVYRGQPAEALRTYEAQSAGMIASLLKSGDRLTRLRGLEGDVEVGAFVRARVAGFVAQEWDVSKEKTPPKVENAVRTIYVVLRPEPPEQTDPRRPPAQTGMTPEDRKLVQALWKLAENDDAKALVVTINSPGGTMSGGESLYRALAGVAEKKPVIAVMGVLYEQFCGAPAKEARHAR